MNMMFENLFQRIESITMEDIKFEYWDYEKEVEESSEEEESENET